ncbi:MAG: septum formation initiator family protein, partial [Spirochaetales bacterium]|nr:septum formation initiator family protein [Spirochaetales bacterium]
QKTNNSLKLECTALQNDREVIEGLAKKLGYVSDGDKIVKINGLSFEQEKIYDAGTPVKAREPEYLPEWVSKVLGIAAFLTVCLYSLYQDIKSGLFKRRKNPVFMEGIPVYDLPQV